jgi:hypothetical protein
MFPEKSQNGYILSPHRTMPTTVPVFGKLHWGSQYDPSGHLETCMKSKLPKSGSVIRRGTNQNYEASKILELVGLLSPLWYLAL